MNTTSISNEQDYKAALARLELIFDAKKNTLEGDEVEVLGMLIDQYENKNFPIL